MFLSSLPVPFYWVKQVTWLCLQRSGEGQSFLCCLEVKGTWKCWRRGTRVDHIDIHPFFTLVNTAPVSLPTRRLKPLLCRDSGNATVIDDLSESWSWSVLDMAEEAIFGCFRGVIPPGPEPFTPVFSLTPFIPSDMGCWC